MKQPVFSWRTGRVLFVLFLAVLLSVTVSSQDQSATISGQWQGKFPSPDGTSVRPDDPPGVDLAIEHKGDRLSGSAVFYLIGDKGNGPEVIGKDEVAIIDPRFDGSSLTFGVRVKDRPEENKIEMQMTLTSRTEANLVDVADPSAPVIKMKKIQ